MDRETVGRVGSQLEEIAAGNSIELEKAIAFGSRVRGDYTERSDIDIILVSPDFEGVPVARRSREFYLDWNYEQLPEPEFICLTPDEFDSKRKKDPHIVRTAVEEGVGLA